MESNNDTFTLKIAVPFYIKAYVYNRFIETIEWLDPRQFRFFVNTHNLKAYDTNGREIDVAHTDRISNDKGMQLDKLDSFEGVRKCLVKWPVKATTILREPMLKTAAYLEFQTYAVRHRLSIQEARYNLMEEYPDTNCSPTYDESCMNLIRENKGCLVLDFQQFQKLKAERPRLTRKYV
jgi:hypothetical protein